MSVINQMLRDLDARDAGELERAGLPPRLRPLPPVAHLARHPWRMLAIGIAAGAILASAVVLLLRPDLPQAPPAAPPSAPALPAPAASVAPPEKGTAPADIGEMKISTLLSLAQPQQQESPPPAARLPAPSVPAKPPAAVAPPAASAKAVSSAPSEATPPPPAAPALPASKATSTPKATPVVEASSAAAQIDKRAKGGQGREMAEGEYRKGMQAVKRGDNAAALPQFQRALEFDPGMAKARQALLSVLVGARQWAEAQRFAQSGLDLDPSQTGWAMILARLQFEQGDASGALLTLEKHAAHAQADADYHGLFAYLLQKQQRPAEAVEHFQLAVSLRPNEGRWWFGLGLALEGAGRAGEAKEAFQKARTAGNLSADMSAVIEQKLK